MKCIEIFALFMLI